MYKVVVTICITIFGIAFLAALALLTYAGKDTTDLIGMLSAILGAGGLLTGGGAVIFAKKAAENTNGSLDIRIENGVHKVLDERGVIPNGDKFFNVLGSIVTVALVTTIVSRPTSASVIRAMGDAFAGSIRAALGK